MLRPALELAWAVGRQGEAAQPPVPAPRRLRPLLAHSRLTGPALHAIERVVDSDEEFRARVAAAAVEDALGRPAWLWLVRPEGWSEELAGLQRERDEETEAVADARAERRARRRVSALEAELEEMTARVERERQAAERSAGEVAAERKGRRGAEQARDRLAGQLAAAESELGALRTRLADAQARTEAADARAGGADARAAMLAAERDRLAAALRASREELALRHDEVEALHRSGAARGAALSAAVADAGRAAQELGRALADAAAHLGHDGTGGASSGERASRRAATPVAGVPTGTAPASLPGTGPPGRVRAGPSRAVRRRPAPRLGRRVALALPPAVFEESMEAAAHLIRAPGVLLLVDGYNVSFQGWPEVDISTQRERLVAALAELAARAGVAVQVVFDSADDEALRPPPGAPRRAVAVVFSPQGVEADEVIIDRVATLPADRPVVVATSDRRVRDEVRRRGGNLLTSAQLLALLGRGGARTALGRGTPAG